MSSPTQAMPSPLLNIIEFLQHSRDGTGTIKIPARTLENTNRYLSKQKYLPMTYVEGIVASIEHGRPALCRRLDLNAFLMIYKILSLSEECLAYQRGLSLLTQSFHEGSTSSLTERELQAAKKTHLGGEALVFLIGCFVKDELLRWTRRWMGVLALELLTDCDENKKLLLDNASDDIWWCLGNLILEDNCQILKLIAGFIVHETWPDSAPTKELWPPQHKSEASRQFPKKKNQTSQWIVEFENFVVDLAPRGRKNEEYSDVVFAYAVSVGDTTYCVNEGSAILATVSDELNILIPATATTMASYIDICINKIEKATIEIKESQSQTSSSLPTHVQVLTIWMLKSPDGAFFVNARSHSADSINLAFTSLEAASAVKQSLLRNRPPVSRDIRASQLSQAEPIDVSKHPRETTGPSFTSLAAHTAGVRSNNLFNAANEENEPIEQGSKTLIPHVLFRKDDHEHQLSPFSQAREQSWIPPGQNLPLPLFETFPDADVAPLTPRQPAKVGGNTATTKHDQLRTPEQRTSVASISEIELIVHDDRHSLSKDHMTSRGDSDSAESVPAEHDEDHDRLYQGMPSAQNVSTKQANRSSPRMHKVCELQEPAGTAFAPDLNAGNPSEQPCTKMIHRMRKTIGEVAIAPSVNRSASAENAKSALKRKAPFADRRDAASHKMPRFQSVVTPNSGSRSESADRQDGAEFDFPTSAHKTQESTIACLPTSTTASKAQTSSKTARKAKAVPPSKPQLKGLSSRYQAQTYEKEVSKNVPHSVASSPSKEIQFDTDDNGTGQTDRNAGFIKDEARASNKPQHESKKPSKRKPRPKTKHVKDVGDLLYSTKKAQNAPNKKVKRKPKAVGIPLAQSRNKRAAALTANEKIQDLVERESSDEVDLVETHAKKRKTTAQPVHKIGTSSDNLLNSVKKDSRPPPRNPRPPLKDELQVAGSGQKIPVAKSLPNELSRVEGNLKAENSKNVGIPTKDLAQLAGGLPAHDATDTRQSPRVTASYVKPFEDFNVHHAQSELPNVQLTIPPRQVDEVHDSVMNENQEHLEGQDAVLQNNLSHLNISFSSGDGTNAGVPQVSALNNIDVLDGAGGSFFEEATVFSHEVTASFVDNPRDKEISEALALQEKSEHDHDYSRSTNLKSDLALRAAGTWTNIATSTPKPTVVAKLQSGLSSIENRHIQVVSQGTSRKVLGAKATTPTETNGLGLNSSGQDKILRRGQDKVVVPQNQVIKTASAQPDRAMMKNKSVPDLDTQLLGSEDSSDLSEAALVAEPGKSYIGDINNEAPPGLNQKLCTSTRVNRVAQTPIAENTERGPEGSFVAVTRLGENKHIRVGNLTQDMKASRKADKASNNKPQATSIKEAGSAKIPVEAQLDVNHKSNIISFDSTGPRNQGRLSNRKAKAPESSENRVPLSRIAEDRKLKRKFQDLDADIFALDQNATADKRPRASEGVLRTREEASIVAKECKDLATKETMRKPSSQSARVDPNGSPKPFVHARKIALRDPHRHIPVDTINQLAGGKQDNDHEDDYFILQDRVNDSNPSLPFLETQSFPSATRTHFIPTSSSKHRPASPNAPLGIIDEYAAHRVHSRGKFVNLQTENIVMAVRPPDSFVGVQRDPTNNFINQLRRLSNNSSEQNSPVRGAVNNEDPEKTLIETSSAQKKHDSSPASRSSSKPDSSQSNNSTPSEDPSSSGGGDDEDEWAKALQPHQGKTLEVLCEISHRLVRNLISKETAVRDLASDYSLGGNRLIDQFEKSRRQDIDAYRTSIKTLEQKLTELYDNAQQALGAGPENQPSKSLEQVETAWQDHHRSMKMEMEEALALCLQ